MLKIPVSEVTEVARVIRCHCS